MSEEVEIPASIQDALIEDMNNNKIVITSVVMDGPTIDVTYFDVDRQSKTVNTMSVTEILVFDDEILDAYLEIQDILRVLIRDANIRARE